MRSHRTPARTALRLAAAAVLVALSNPGARGDGEADPKLPFKPFAKAKVGDWATIVLESRDRNSAASGVTVVKLEIVEVKGDEVVIDASGHCGGKRTFNVKKDMGLASYLWLVRCDEPGKLESLSTENDARAVGKKRFACAKLSWKTAPEKKAGVGLCKTCALWVSPEAKGFGLVAWEYEHTYDKVLMRSVKAELAGFGSANKTEWGKTAAETRAARYDNDKKVPIDLTQAKVGDWSAERCDGAGVYGWTIETIDEENVLIVGPADATDTWKLGPKLKKKAVTIMEYLIGMGLAAVDADDDDSVCNLKVEDKPYKLEGKEFACKRVAFEHCSWGGQEGDEHGGRGAHILTYVLWFSSEVKGFGLVAAEQGFNARKLLGYGSKDKVDWGLTIKDARAKFDPPPKKQ